MPPDMARRARRRIPLLRIRTSRLALLAAMAVITLPPAVLAQTTTLPTVTVETQQKKAQPKTTKPVPAAPSQTQTVETPPATGGSLTVPNTAEIQAQFATIAGAVTLVPDTAYKYSTPSATLKDALDYVPGLFVQPKWGEDARLSIRGSGLSRNFHLRGLNLYMDGIPINTADGFGDLQEIDPTAYRYIEVFKGANGLRFGGMTLGGAINFVTPTGRDADLLSTSVDIGSFGFHRLQSSTGGVSGPVDFFLTGTWQEQDGFRDHSGGESTRVSSNLGYRISPTAETRFYFNISDIQQRIPGSVTKDVALNSPKTAATDNLLNDWQRDISSWRIANATTVKLAPGTVVEFGGFLVDRHLMHPIFEWLDYQYNDYGGFVRLKDESQIGGFKNRLLVGLTVHDGTIDNNQFTNSSNSGKAIKGTMTSSSLDSSDNLAFYAENAFYFLPQMAVVAGTQFLYATRTRRDRFFNDAAINPADTIPDDSGSSAFRAWSPKAGLLWDVDRSWQVFFNVAKSAEVPSFGENTPVVSNVFDAKLQTATTFELGTRGNKPDVSWDLTLYRAMIDNELMCVSPTASPFFCSVVNANKTVHQGIEAGFGLTVAKSLLVPGATPDRLWLNLAYTFSDFRFDNDPLYGDNQLPGAPRHYLRAELLYKHPNGIFFGPNVEWVPVAYYIDSANTVDTEPYALWGLKFGYDPKTAFSFYVEARNLADKHYVSSTGITNVASAASPFFEPGTGRSVFSGIKYKW